MGSLFSSSKPKESNVGGTGRKKPQKKKPNQIDSKDKAILDLKNARDRLKKYQTKLELESATLQENARQLLRLKKKDRAMLALKMKKFKQQQIQTADQQLLTVLEMVDSVEWESQQLQVFQGLKAGNSILNAIHKEMSVEAVETLMDETAEAQEVANEISSLIGGSLTAEDEESVLEELAEIERMEAQALQTTLPEGPTDAPISLETGDIEVKAKEEAEPVKKATKKEEKIPVLA